MDIPIHQLNYLCMQKIQRKGKDSSKKATLIHTISLFIFPPNIVQKVELALSSSPQSLFLAEWQRP